MPIARKRSPEDWAIDITLGMIVLGSFAWIYWYHIQSVKLDNLVFKMIGARLQEDVDSFSKYRESAHILISEYQSWTLSGAYFGLAAGLIVFAHRSRQRLV